MIFIKKQQKELDQLVLIQEINITLRNNIKSLESQIEKLFITMNEQNRYLQISEKDVFSLLNQQKNYENEINDLNLMINNLTDILKIKMSEDDYSNLIENIVETANEKRRVKNWKILQFKPRQ